MYLSYGIFCSLVEGWRSFRGRRFFRKVGDAAKTVVVAKAGEAAAGLLVGKK